MRLAPFTILLFVMYITIGIYDQTISDQGVSYGNGGESFLFNALLQPWNWSGMSFLVLLGSAVFVAAGVAAGTAFFSRSDINSLYALFLAFVAIGAVPIISIYNFVTRNVGMYACTVGTSCGPANIVGALTAGVLAIFWIFTCVEWWSWRPATQ